MAYVILAQPVCTFALVCTNSEKCVIARNTVYSSLSFRNNRVTFNFEQTDLPIISQHLICKIYMFILNWRICYRWRELELNLNVPPRFLRFLHHFQNFHYHNLMHLFCFKISQNLLEGKRFR